MTDPNGPVIIRQSSAPPLIKPGVHAYNRRRRFNVVRERISNLSILQLCLAALGLAGIGYYTYTLVDEHVYQSFQNWAFEQGIAGRSDVTFADYLSERTLFGFLTRGNKEAKASGISQPPASADPIRPAQGAVLGRLEIARLHLSAMVREGVDDKILRVAVGHVPATALPGQAGNFAIAAHRDTLFRALKDIRNDDLVTFQLTNGDSYQYRVAATQIVKPSDVTVLRSDGGGLIIDDSSIREMPKLLTMITCYPFSYVGSAPKRFVVEAKLVEGAPKRISASIPLLTTEAATPIHSMPVRSMAHRRGVWPQRTKQATNKPLEKTLLRGSAAPVKPAKRKGFWRKLFSNG
ncbi:MAG: class D sortase [Acidobacteriaceae bacterium]|nr:class D sortase [Acidobacteriaceae bacterium]